MIFENRAIGWDHISAAIGFLYMALLNGADIINTVIREEYTGGIPFIDSIYEAIKSSQVVVKPVNDVSVFKDFNNVKNENKNNCMGIIKSDIGSDRCKSECLFWLSRNFPV